MAENNNEVKLYARGRIYNGWTKVSITRSIESASGSFSLTVTNEEEDTEGLPPIFMGDPCKVKIGEETLVNGYVDEVSPSFDDGSHTVGVTGRDRTGDIVDCTPDAPVQLKNQSLEQIARHLCAPFGISVKKLTDTGETFPKFNIDPGEKIFESLEKHAKKRGVLLVSDGAGNLVITRPGSERASTSLREPGNILSGDASYKATDRFSKYIAKGQGKGSESSDRGSAGVDGVAYDRVIERHRPLILMDEGGSDSISASKRAQWEAIVRAAKGSEVSLTVQGWRQQNGNLWKPNQLVSVESHKLWIRANLLITEVTYKRDNGGTTCDLTLRRPDAFIPQEQFGKKEGSIARGNEPWAYLV